MFTPFLFPHLQDPCQSGLQQHCHPGGSQEERLFTKLGETAFKEQRHPATELTAAADSCHERIADRSLQYEKAKNHKLESPVLCNC